METSGSVFYRLGSVLNLRGVKFFVVDNVHSGINAVECRHIDRQKSKFQMAHTKLNQVRSPSAKVLKLCIHQSLSPR